MLSKLENFLEIKRRDMSEKIIQIYKLIDTEFNKSEKINLWPEILSLFNFFGIRVKTYESPNYNLKSTF